MTLIIIIGYAIGATLCYAALWYGTGRREWDEFAVMAVFSALVWWLLLPVLAYAYLTEGESYHE